jgi:DNA-binding NarL/FixJ family response regulator
MIKILLVDDDPNIRRGVRMHLALESDLSVVGEEGDGGKPCVSLANSSPM